MPWDRQSSPTHEVSNQVPDLVDYNVYLTDIALQEAVEREGAGAQAASLAQYGARLGQADLLVLAAEVNRVSPVLHAFDRTGHRVDQVVFHPRLASIHALGF